MKKYRERKIIWKNNWKKFKWQFVYSKKKKEHLLKLMNEG